MIGKGGWALDGDDGLKGCSTRQDRGSLILNLGERVEKGRAYDGGWNTH